jgi:ribosome-binding factor A
MPYESRRPDRVAEAIRQEVAMFLAEGVKDPRVQGLVTVTAVDVTRDLRQARVFVSVMGTTEQRAATMEGLSSATGYLRSRLGRALRLRVAPQVEFQLDPSIEQAARIDALLSQIRSDDTVKPDGGDPT